MALLYMSFGINYYVCIRARRLYQVLLLLIGSSGGFQNLLYLTGLLFTISCYGINYDISLLYIHKTALVQDCNYFHL